MIKINMPMPKSCKECRFGSFDPYTEITYCYAAQEGFSGRTRKASLCPLKEDK